MADTMTIHGGSVVVELDEFLVTGEKISQFPFEVKLEVKGGRLLIYQLLEGQMPVELGDLKVIQGKLAFDDGGVQCLARMRPHLGIRT